MKQKVFFIGFAILMNLSVFGQNFISFDKQWNVRQTGWGGSFSTEIYIIDGDTAINSINYNKIWASFDSLSTWQYQGLLREDSNIVYYIPPNGVEGVLYDFNLEVGDTAYINNVFCSDIPIYIIDIDTVNYFGITRKRWLLGGDGYAQEFWIEGIGSQHGPLHTKFMSCIVCPVWELLCYHDNNTLEYIMYGQTDCFQKTIGIEEITGKNKILIMPNPVKKGASIEIKMDFIPANIDILNSSGNLVQRLTSIQNETIKIETNDLETGIYLLKVTNQENKIKTLKIIIH